MVKTANEFNLLSIGLDHLILYKTEKDLSSELLKIEQERNNFNANSIYKYKS